MEEKENHLAEKIEFKQANDAIPFLSNFSGQSALNFCTKNSILSKKLSYLKTSKKKLYYQLKDGDYSVDLDYCLEESNILHIRYKISNVRKVSFSKLIVNYAILLGADPDYTWVPHVRPKENLVMGDHIYRSPVIIYKKGKVSFAFIPDLKTLEQNRPFQTFLDFNLKPKIVGGSPQISYGFGNYKPTEHVLFKQNPNKKWKVKKNTDLTFRYYIITFIDKNVQEILEFINNFFWEKYGRRLLYENLAPQVIPYDINAREGFKAIIERHKLWGDFKLNGQECGGYWQASWMGAKKTPINFMDPKECNLEWQQKRNMTKLVSEETFYSKIIMYFANRLFWIKRFDKYTRHHAVIKRNAEIWFNAWFNSMRSAYGFRYFGEIWSDRDLIERGDKILTTFFNLPRENGLSPSVLLPAALGGSEYSVIKGMQGFFYVDYYSIVDCCISTYWALKYSQDFKEKEREIVDISRNLANFLKGIQFENGEIPVYVNFKSSEKTPMISNILKNSASSGAPLMFLTEYFKISKDETIIPVMEKIAKYIQKEIIPEDKWHDFECFYSCTHLPVNFYDSHTKKHVMNGLCIHWCADGMKELYKITNKKEYLILGERIIAVLSLFQQIWRMPYISFNTFGGFCAQNSDAELSDARHGLFVRMYAEYYLLTGKKEYMERAIATQRACWALQFLREYEQQCPGNLKGIETLDGVDRGIIVENYGHMGYDFRVPGYWMPDWGFGTSVSATAYMKTHFGDLFLDFKEKETWGIDGILTKTFEFQPQKVIIEAEVIQGKSYIIVKGRDAPAANIDIVLNGKSLAVKSKEEIEQGFLIKL